MDIRLLLKDFLLVILCINIHPGLSFIEDDYEDGASFGRCPWIRNKLKNGRVRYRYKGRVAKFLCDSGYDLAGKRSSTCVRGQWSNPVPVCVARGCSRVPMVSNGHVTEMYRGALLVYDCNPGYTLDGVASIHCDGRRWSTSPPECVVATERPEMTCDFENPDLCGWSHDPNHEFDWKRNQFATPSGHAGTGPSFDHTFGENKGGYYLFIEASSPRKINDTARLFSPVYSGSLSGGCFLFWYHMYGATTGGLRVYLKPESHVFDELLPKWEKFGDQGNEWNRGSIPIPVLHENFQIVIEGIRGESYVGDSAIDDVSLTTHDCDSMGNETGTVENTNAESCRGRCREGRHEEPDSSCGCNDNCYLEHNCCSDYATFCFEGNETTVQNTDETASESLSKTSPIPSTYIVTSKISEEYTSSSPTKSALNYSSMGTVEAITSSTILLTSQVTNSSFSSSSGSYSEVPLDVTAESTAVSTSITLPSTTVQIKSTSTTATTAKPSSTVSSSTKPTVSSSTSVATTKSPTTSEKTITSSTIRTTTSSTLRTTTSATTTSSKTPVQTTFISVTPRKTTVLTTSPTPVPTTFSTSVPTTFSKPVTTTFPTTEPTTFKSTEPTTFPTTEPTTFPTTQPTTFPTTQPTTFPKTEPIAFSTTAFTTSVPTSRFTTFTPQTTPISSTSLSTTENVQYISSSPMPASSVTTKRSTIKKYNLRHRTRRTTTRRTTTPVSSVTYASTKTASATQRLADTSVLPRTSSVPPSTRLNDNIATMSIQTISTKGGVPIYMHSSPVPPYYEATSTRIQHSTKFSTTEAPEITLTSRQYTTGKLTSQIFKFTSTQTPSSYPGTSDSYDMGASKAETTSSSSKMPLVISLLVVILIIAAGVAYYMRRKQKSKRQSKLSDDSEMRFLQENEYMEYSDASALDRILIK